MQIIYHFFLDMTLVGEDVLQGERGCTDEIDLMMWG